MYRSLTDKLDRETTPADVRYRNLLHVARGKSTSQHRTIRLVTRLCLVTHCNRGSGLVPRPASSEIATVYLWQSKPELVPNGQSYRSPPALCGRFSRLSSYPTRPPNQINTALTPVNFMDGWAARSWRLIDSCSPSRNELSQPRCEIFSRTLVRVATRNHRQNN
jgi:hypothetical protein